MIRSTRTSGSIASVLCLLALVVGLTVASAPVAADHADGAGPDRFVAEQGDRCVPLRTVGDGTENVSSFYDYRRGTGSDYGSHGTDDLQRSGVSQLFVHHGSEGVSLVVLNDARNDGGGGGAASMTFTGLPTDGVWAVEDDSYRDQDDRFRHDGDHSEIDWMWAPNRTDGAAFRGLGLLDSDDTVRVHATFGEGSYGYERGWPYADDEVTWAARDADDALVDLNASEPVAIRPAPCGGPPTAALSASPSPPVAGQAVTLDASNATDERGVVEYRWDPTGDGNLDLANTDPQVTHTYDAPGAVAPSVTVVDADGNTDTAEVRLDVVEQSPSPDAALSAPDAVGVGEDVAFDAANATVPAGATEYRWDVGADGSVERTTTAPTLERRFETPGDRTVTVTVVDARGRTDSASATVSVVDRTAPDPEIEAPDGVEAGESITLEASGSTDDATYEWTLGDGTTATGATVSHAYDAPGTYEVGLTVTDAGGNAAEATTDVTVTDDGNDGTDDGTDESDDGEGENGDNTDETDDGDDGESDDGEDDDGTDDNDSNDTDESDDNADESDENGDNTDESDDDADENDDETDGSDDAPTGGAAPDPNDGGDDDAGAALSADRNESGDVAVSLTDGTAGERTSTGVPASENATASLSGLTIAPAADGAFRTTLRRATTPASPSGTDAGLLELVPADAPAAEAVAYRFVVDDETYAAAPGALRVYEADGSDWRRLDADARANGSTVRVNASGDALSPVVLATAATEARARSVDVAADPVVGRPTAVTATVANAGENAGTTTAALRTDDGVADAKRVALPANGTATVALNATLDESGTHRLSVAGENRTVSVAPAPGTVGVTDLSVGSDRVETGETVTVTATYENRGDETARTRANFTVAGSAVADERVTVEPDETATVAFEYAFAEAGTYSVAVDGEVREVTVAGGSDTAGENATATPSSSGPVPTGTAAVVGGLGVLLAGAAAAGRWLQ